MPAGDPLTPTLSDDAQDERTVASGRPPVRDDDEPPLGAGGWGMIDNPEAEPDLRLHKVVPVKRNWRAVLRGGAGPRVSSIWTQSVRDRDADTDPAMDPPEDSAAERPTPPLPTLVSPGDAPVPPATAAPTPAPERPPLILAIVAGIVVLALAVAIGAAVHSFLRAQDRETPLPPVEPYRGPARVAEPPPPALPTATEVPATPEAPAAAPEAPAEATPAPAAGPSAGSRRGSSRGAAQTTERLETVAEPDAADPWATGEDSGAAESGDKKPGFLRPRKGKDAGTDTPP
jgi:hypothetical protein